MVSSFLLNKKKAVQHERGPRKNKTNTSFKLHYSQHNHNQIVESNDLVLLPHTSGCFSASSSSSQHRSGDTNFSMFMPNLSITTPSPPSFSSSSCPSPKSQQQSPMLNSSSSQFTCSKQSNEKQQQQQQHLNSDLFKIFKKSKSNNNLTPSTENEWLNQSILFQLEHNSSHLKHVFNLMQHPAATTTATVKSTSSEHHLEEMKHLKQNETDLIASQRNLFYSQLFSLLQQQQSQSLFNANVSQSFVYVGFQSRNSNCLFFF